MEKKQKILLKKLGNVNNGTRILCSKLNLFGKEIDPLSFSSACCDLDEALELIQKVSSLLENSNNNPTHSGEETDSFTNDESLFSDPTSNKTRTFEDKLSEHVDRTSLPAHEKNNEDFDSDVTDDFENFDQFNINDDNDIKATSDKVTDNYNLGLNVSYMYMFTSNLKI